MAREVPEIDRLIEEGLTLYGQGDLTRALAQWEKALAIDPDNAQATSYIDYVRQNYELLTNESNGEATIEGAPFGIAEDEAEYQIEIQPGEIKPTIPTISPPLFMDPLDEGWFIDQETHDTMAYRGPPGIALDHRPSQELTVEMEADEPPPPPPREPAPAPPRPRRDSSLGMEFDEATSEYDKRQHVPPPHVPEMDGPAYTSSTAMDEFSQEGNNTPGFGHPNDFQTPPGFGTQATGIKQRELGFVKALPVQSPMTSTELGLPERPRPPAKASQPPPSMPADEAAFAPANSLDELTLEPALPPPEDAPTSQRPPLHASDLDDLDLISSLPSPRPALQVPRISIDTPLSGATKHTTRDYPQPVRTPATARTRDMTPAEVLVLPPSMGSAQTQDFESKTQERHRAADPSDDMQTVRLSPDHPIVMSAPTRDLGLREASARADSVAARSEGTRSDVMLAFDPIDARTTEIIEDVDETAPEKEAPEDKTRRRITTLFEKAAQWSGEGDLERAVAAVDLALSEDPNSALAQKLIHRNRDTMMTVFQAYLGDLQRTPQLTRPLHELANAPISPRAAFLLSRIDGGLSIDEILDVCGMPRLEAYRYLCQLFLRGILR